MMCETVSTHVKQIAQDCASRFPNDIDGAVAAAIDEIRRLPDVSAAINELAAWAVLKLVHEARCNTNKIVKDFGTRAPHPTRIKASMSRSLLKAEKSLYDMCISGRILG